MARDSPQSPGVECTQRCTQRRRPSTDGDERSWAGRRMNGERSNYQRASDGRWFGSIVVTNELGQPKRRTVSANTKDGARQEFKRLMEEQERLQAESLPPNRHRGNRESGTRPLARSHRRHSSRDHGRRLSIQLTIGAQAFWLAFAYSVRCAPASVGVMVE